MRRNHWIRVATLLLTGGTVFQATTSCSNEGLDALTNSLLPALSTALITAISGSTQCDADASASTGSGSITPSNGVFSAVNDAIQGVRSNLGVTAVQPTGSS